MIKYKLSRRKVNLWSASGDKLYRRLLHTRPVIMVIERRLSTATEPAVIPILIVVFYRGLYSHDFYIIVVTAKSAAEPAAKPNFVSAGGWRFSNIHGG